MDSKNESRANGLVLQGDILNSKQEAAALLEWTNNFLLLDESRDEVNEFDHNPYNQTHPIQMDRSPPVLNPHFNHPIRPPTPPSTPPSSPPPSLPPPLSPPPPPPTHPPSPQRHPVLCMTTDDKPRLRWTPELHEHFVACAAQLGGPFGATPKHIMRKMNVDGLTILHVKSHLQKYRATMLMESNELAHTPSPFQRHQSTSYEEPALQSTAEGTEMFPGQLSMQDSQFSQSQVQMSLQIQEEAQEKYLKSLMKRAYDFCAPKTTQRKSIKHQKCENSSQVLFPSPPCMSTEQSDMQSYYCQLQRSLDIKEGQDKYLMQQGYDTGTPQTTDVGSLNCSKSENFSQVLFPTLPRISAEQTDRQSNIEQLTSLLPAMEAYNISSKNAEVKTTLASGSPLQNNQNSPCVVRDSFPGSGSPLFGMWPEVDHYSFDEIDP